jgi:hypothetical protein
VLARLAEGHTEAVAILAEADRSPVPGALYGMWAAKSGGTGATLENGALTGTVRFCPGLSVLAHLRERGEADEHQPAHVGAMHTALGSAEAILAGAAGGEVDTLLAGTCRAAAERTAVEALERALKVTGPTPACRDRRFAQRVAGLPVYLRQHHAERDLAALGRAVHACRPLEHGPRRSSIVAEDRIAYRIRHCSPPDAAR